MKPRRPHLISTPTPPVGAPSTPDPFDLHAYEAIEKLRAESGPGAEMTAHVFKRRADGTRIDRCKRFPLADLDLDALPLTFGGGDFSIRVTDARGAEVETVRVSFDPELYPAPRPAIPPGPPPPAAAQVHDAAGDAVRELRQELAAAQVRHMQFLETLVVNSLGRGAGTLKDRIEELNALRSIVNREPRQELPAAQLAESFRAGMDAARSLADGAGERGDVLDKLIEKLGPIFVESLIHTPARPGAGALPAADTDRPAPAASGSPAPRLPEEWKPYAFLARYVGTAISTAQAGTAPEAIADTLYDLIPDQHLDALAQFVHLDTGRRRQLFAALDPRLVAHTDFLEAVTVKLREILDADDTDDADTAE